MATPDEASDDLHRPGAVRADRTAWRTSDARSSVERQAAAPPGPARGWSWRDLVGALWFRQPA